MIERLFKSTYKIGSDMQFERFIESNLYIRTRGDVNFCILFE